MRKFIYENVFFKKKFLAAGKPLAAGLTCVKARFRKLIRFHFRESNQVSGKMTVLQNT